MKSQRNLTIIEWKILLVYLWCKAGPQTRTVLSSDAEASTWDRRWYRKKMNKKIPRRIFIKWTQRPDGRQGSKRHSWLFYCGRSAQQWPHLSSHERCKPEITKIRFQEKLEKASDLVVFRARGDEGLVKATKAAVDGVEALGDPHKLPNKGSGKFAQIKNN